MMHCLIYVKATKYNVHALKNKITIAILGWWTFCALSTIGICNCLDSIDCGHFFLVEW